LDDGYSPPKTVEQIRRLVEQEGVAFIFNSLGTPTNTAVQRYLNERKVPQLFVGTGADKWGGQGSDPGSAAPGAATDGAASAIAESAMIAKPDKARRKRSAHAVGSAI
jgi:branched-chain amino acid transport system substrate-binding protein